MKQLYMEICKHIKMLVIGFQLIILLVNCSGNSALQIKSETLNSYIILGPGDEIEIKFFFPPELAGVQFQEPLDLNEIQTIRQDGYISLKLVGEVHVEGMTIPDLQEHLKLLYTALIKDPEITIILRNRYNAMIHIGGEVISPGFIRMQEKLTVLEAIIQAGGINTRTASAKNIKLIREIEEKTTIKTININDILKGNESQQVFLEPRDIVFIPRTRITVISQWLDRNLYSILPPGFTYLIPYIIFDNR
jgi:polysaccharide export outer membrane protein